MAVTFLVVSRSERGTVRATQDQAAARMESDTALEVAQAELLAAVMAFNDPHAVGLMVSTNYINPYGFVPGNTFFTNVNFDYLSAGGPVTGNNALQAMANSLYLPRAPVWVTNRLTRANESRFYLDLNRNGRFDPNGRLTVTNALNQPILDSSNAPITDFFTGDPEWVATTERGAYMPAMLNTTKVQNFPLGYPHSATNQYIGRYAFMIVPTSAALDVNNIHNYAKASALPPTAMTAGDGFLRNMGAGSYEMNLASLLVDLNTNMWPATSGSAYGGRYVYATNNSAPSTGAAFEDSVAFLRYRYNKNWKNLSSVSSQFGNNGVTAFGNDYIDGFTAGPLMTGAHWTPINDADRPRVNLPGWSGSDNPNHFFDTQDFFDTNKTAVGVSAGSYTFTDRLKIAGTNSDSYDRYTFYRLLSQLGTDSSPEAPKLNLNYVNVDNNGTILPNMATNFNPWAPVQFFTNAAIRMITDTFSVPTDTNFITNFIVTVAGRPQIRIQVYPTNFYTPSVQRVFQVAANIYDASTTRSNTAYPYLPSVFRPIFFDGSLSGKDNKIYLTDFAELTDAAFASPGTAPAYHDPAESNVGRPYKPGSPPYMIYGIPLVIGAKKGLPNFNEYALLNDIRVTRKMTFHRPAAGAPINQTNQIYTVGISNVFGVEAWNSYSNAFPRALRMVVAAEVITSMTNEFGAVRGWNGLWLSNSFPSTAVTNIPAMAWSGFNKAQSPISFVIPISTNYLVISNAPYSFSQRQFLGSGLGPNDPANEFPIPHWALSLKTRLRFILVDTTATPNRIVDYVNLSSAEAPVDISDQLKRQSDGSDAPCDGTFDNQIGSLFCTNRIRNSASVAALTYGLNNQLHISLGDPGVSDTWWKQFNAQVNDKDASITEFRLRLYGTDPSQTAQTDFAAPFTPTRIIHQNTSWQVNDPLVHYTVPDLTDYMSGKKKISFDDDTTSSPLQDFGGLSPGSRAPLNAHYRPWGGNPNKQSGKGKDTDPPTDINLAVKDPGVIRSDYWDFPTNKYPNIGWLGRVHRGTPWQTLYLKAWPQGVDTNAWTKWSGHILTNWSGTGLDLFDFIRTNPTNDFHIVDLFTTAFNDNASRGQLSVNQTNLAAWSAVLGGVIVNPDPTNFTFIAPAGVYNAFNTNTWPPLLRIVNGINRTRTNALLFPNQKFARLGDILNTPELTITSPYLGTNTAALNDEVYERIPQQTLSLLRGNEQPRFVVYAYGQALKPAEHSILTSGQYRGMCTNYQVTAEVATRAVVRIEGAPANPHVVIESYNVLPPYQ